MIAAAGAINGQHRAWIEQFYDSGSLIILPRVSAGHNAKLRYELSSIKSDSNGNASTSRQSNSVKLTQGQSKTLSRLSLNINPGDRYLLTLKVYEGTQLVAEDVVTYPTQ
jgi:hypothetical protein